MIIAGYAGQQEYLDEWLNDSPSWDAEQYVEQNIGKPVPLPPLSWFAERVDDIELLHLEMFFRSKSTAIGTYYRSLIGSVRPNLLLLGDRHNANSAPWYYAAFGPWGGSGVWLLEFLLLLQGSMQKQIALANAGEENLPCLLESLQHPTVLALGREAERECIEQFIECEYLPHPQWYRRFRNKEHREYAERIARRVSWSTVE